MRTVKLPWLSCAQATGLGFKDFVFTSPCLRWATTIIVVGWCFLNPYSSAAQQGQFSQNKTDQTLRSILRIDPTTLGLNLQVPLNNYPGRGQTDLPVTLNYSSKVWSEVELPETGSPEHPLPALPKARYAVNSSAGWTSSLSVPMIQFTGRDQSFDSYGNPCAGCSSSIYYFIPRIYVHMPGGSTHEFRKSDIPIATQSAPTAADFDGTYYAVDGSRMRYETATKTLYLPDGSRFELGDPESNLPPASAPATRYIDRNGNTLTYSPSTKKWTDTLGRVIGLPIPMVPAQSDDIWTTSPNGQTVGDVTYVSKGLSGADLNCILRWKKLENALTDPSQPLRYTGSHFRTQHPTPVPGPYLFSEYFAADAQLFNPVILSEIILPNGQSYKLTYNVWGEIDKVVYPTGGYERFVYQGVTSISRYAITTNRGVVERRVSAKGDGTDEAVWSYSAGYAGPNYAPPYTASITEPDGTRTERLLYVNQDPQTVQCGFDNALAGMAYEERVYSSGNQLLRRTLKEWAVSGPTPGGWSTATRDPRSTKQISILFEIGYSGALAQMVVNEYDSNSDPSYYAHLNVRAVRQFHFVVADGTTAQSGNLSALAALFTSQQPARIVEASYLYHQDYVSRNLSSLPVETRILESTGVIVAKTQKFYDEAAYPTLAYGGSVSQWTDPVSAKRGNVTTVRRYVNPLAGTYRDMHIQYDQFGNARKAWDGNGNLSETEYSSDYFYAYPTRMLSPVPDSSGQHGSNTELLAGSTYDVTTGSVLTSFDANGQTTTFEYASADVLGNANPMQRLTKVTRPTSGGWTSYGYGDTPGNVYVTTRTQLASDRWAEVVQYVDGLGRSVRTEQKEGATSIYAEMQYDSMARPWKKSNPYRTGETVRWTTVSYDELGRVREVLTPDEVVMTNSYGLTTGGNQLGQTATATDQAGKQRRSLIDALGQLTRVDEPNAGGSLGPVNNPLQPTSYSYDILGNLRTISQGAQTRTFFYNSLSQTTSATDPESGTTSYSYDSNGNLIGKTDARQTTSTYTYDALNRMITRAYAGGTAAATPTVAYYYDGTGVDLGVSNALGHLTCISNTVSETRYTGFDAMGRKTGSQQITDGQTYTLAYTYDLAGNLINQTYPSGRVVKSFYDQSNRLSGVSSHVTPRPTRNYATSFAYAAHGAIKQMQLGNGRYEHALFNSRLQVIEVGLGTTAGGSELLRLDFDYGTTTNNGNLSSQTITVPTIGAETGFAATQTYGYDELNRLKSAVETVNTQQAWRQAYTYDLYGNRRFDTTQTTIPDSTWTQAIFNPQFDQNNNRMAAGQGYEYDSVGNLVQDATGKRFAYDGENKQKSFGTGGSLNNGGTYYYDGHGRRVKKIIGNQANIFVYNSAGQVVADYTVGVLPPATPSTRYLTTDALGSPRVITDGYGNVVARHDYLPFGEELSSTLQGVRTANQWYQTDDIRQKFTQYERDGETELDYAQARYYSSLQGRFNSPDPVNGSILSPQSLNRYSYVVNDPLNRIDPDGRYPRSQHEFITFLLVVWLGRGAEAADAASGAAAADDFRNAAFPLLWNIPKHFGKPGSLKGLKGYELGVKGHLVQDNGEGGPHQIFKGYGFFTTLANVLAHAALDVAGKSPDKAAKNGGGFEDFYNRAEAVGEKQPYPKEIVEFIRTTVNEAGNTITFMQIFTADGQCHEHGTAPPNGTQLVRIGEKTINGIPVYVYEIKDDDYNFNDDPIVKGIRDAFKLYGSSNDMAEAEAIYDYMVSQSR